MKYSYKNRKVVSAMFHVGNTIGIKTMLTAVNDKDNIVHMEVVEMGLYTVVDIAGKEYHDLTPYSNITKIRFSDETEISPSEKPSKAK